MALDGKAEFRNTTTGFIGAITYTPSGEEKAIAVAPGDTVWLSEDEQELTANAPRLADDNPFLSRPFEVRDPNTGELLESGERPQLELVSEHRMVPSRKREIPGIAKGEPAPEGAFAQGEEVGTPVSG